MKIYRRLSFWYSVLILIVLSIIILISLTYGKNERLIPLIIAASGAVLTILVLIGEKYPNLISRFDFSITEIKIEGMETRNGHAGAGDIPFKKILIFLAWVGWAVTWATVVLKPSAPVASPSRVMPRVAVVPVEKLKTGPKVIVDSRAVLIESTAA